jgi:indole-3-glycerol phosphate synthase
MLSVAHEVGLSALVEAHTQADLDKVLASAATMVGVNARDLETLEVDPDRALALAAKIPAGRTVVLESGIATRRQVDAAAEAGVAAVLVGEALMRSTHPEVTIRKLTGSLRPAPAATGGED